MNSAAPADALGSLDFAALGRRYRSGAVDPAGLVAGLLARIAARGDDKVWIHLLPRDELVRRAEELAKSGPAGRPLYGIPFAIKDNIDLARHPTTAACPEYSYVPSESAPVVAALIAAGAMPIGKTNLDQFATGLVGTRSPYGACASAFDRTRIAGGSSSGSAVAVAAGLVSFALGTDTAGSGRVPAAFNNLIGLKPTRGAVSSRGVVPACRSLDCVSLFALCAADARAAFAVARGFDPADPFSRPPPADAAPPSLGIAGCRFGVPRSSDLEFFGNGEGARLFAAMAVLVARLGGRVVEIDFAPFRETARLLYDGPWLAERYEALGDFIERHPAALHPVTRQVIEAGARPRAVDAFAGYHRLKALRRAVETSWQSFDVLLTPTAPRSYTIAEVAADPLRLNANLGIYTNFMNLLDLSAVALPAGFQADGLPFGVTLAAPAFHEELLLVLADRLHRAQAPRLGALTDPLPDEPVLPRTAAAPKWVRVAVCGAHMAGLPLNHQLTERHGRFVRRCRTAPQYRMFAFTDVTPIRPGLLRAAPGAAIEIEVWELPSQEFGGFVEAIRAPLGIGTIELDDGESVRGFLCESYATETAEEITQIGGWRDYLARREAP